MNILQKAFRLVETAIDNSLRAQELRGMNLAEVAGLPQDRLGSFRFSEIEALAEGIDAVKVVQDYSTTHPVATEDRIVKTVHGDLRFGDIPRDEHGSVPPQWLTDNCPCEEHERARAAGTTTGGQYL